MPSLTKKIVHGKPYYYLRECQCVNGKPKIISTLYLGSAENIRDRLLRPHPPKSPCTNLVVRPRSSPSPRPSMWSLSSIAMFPNTAPRSFRRPLSPARCPQPLSGADQQVRYRPLVRETALSRSLPFTAAQLTSHAFGTTWNGLAPTNCRHRTGSGPNCRLPFRLGLCCLLFDATNFFTFLDSFNLRAKLPQRGHGKQGHDTSSSGIGPDGSRMAKFRSCITLMPAISTIR